MYTKISDYVTCYNPYCIAIHIAYDTHTSFSNSLSPLIHSISETKLQLSLDLAIKKRLFSTTINHTNLRLKKV